MTNQPDMYSTGSMYCVSCRELASVVVVCCHRFGYFSGVSPVFRFPTAILREREYRDIQHLTPTWPTDTGEIRLGTLFGLMD